MPRTTIATGDIRDSAVTSAKLEDNISLKGYIELSNGKARLHANDSYLAATVPANGSAKGIAIGGLLISDTYSEYVNVPVNGAYIKGSLIVKGNLTVDGTTVTVNTTELNVADNIIVLNNNVTGTPNNDAGIEINRGSLNNALILWNENSDYWQIAQRNTSGQVVNASRIVDEAYGNSKYMAINNSSFNNSLTVTSSTDQILNLRQVGGGWNYITFLSDTPTPGSYTRKGFIGVDSTETTFVISGDNGVNKIQLSNDVIVSGDITISEGKMVDGVDISAHNSNSITNVKHVTDAQLAALAGTSGTPGSGNKYVTNSDARLSDARTPILHDDSAHSELSYFKKIKAGSTETAATTGSQTITFVGSGAASASISGATVTISATNNYLTGVSGSGNGTVTFTRSGLGNLTWDATHTHSYVALNAANQTITGNLTISGNLTVNGTSTTINTATLNVADNIITLNSNYVGDPNGESPPPNAGIEINRGTGDKATIRWDEANRYWTLTNIGLTTYPTLSVFGGIGSIPENAANEPFKDVRVLGNTYTNLVKNGNFADGTANFILDGSTQVSLIGNELTFIATTQYGRLRQSEFFQPISGHKYYYSVNVKADSNLVSAQFYAKTATPIQKEHSGSGAYERLSVIQTGGTETTIQINVIDKRSSGWTNISAKDFVVIDLTATFGAGNEPTKDQCDKIFTNWFDGTKSTVSAMRLKSVGKNLFDKSKIIEGSYYSATGAVVNDSTSERIEEYIKVEPNKNYTANNWIRISFYDYQKNHIQRIDAISFITPSNCYYIRIAQYQKGLGYLDSIQLEQGSVATAYEPYTESTAYIMATDEEGNPVELRSLPNGVRDEIVISGREAKLIKRISDWFTPTANNVVNFNTAKTNVDVVVLQFPSNCTTQTLIDSGGKFLIPGIPCEPISHALADNTSYIGKAVGFDSSQRQIGVIVSKGKYTSLSDAKSKFLTDYNITQAIYQLAEPIELPIQVSGTLVANPGGTIYIEPEDENWSDKVIPDVHLIYKAVSSSGTEYSRIVTSKYDDNLNFANNRVIRFGNSLDTAYMQGLWGNYANEIVVGGDNVNGLSLRTNGTNRLYIDKDGNVGIGKVTPKSKLDVDGTIRATSLVKWDGSSTKEAIYEGDSRLTNARTPTAHALISTSNHTVSGLTAGHVIKATGATTYAFAQLQHSDLGGIGANDHHTHQTLTIGTGLNGGSYNTTSATTISVKYGTTAGTACEGNDSRLSNKRDPNNHNLVDTTVHPVSGLTSGHVLMATGATTYGFGQLQHSQLGGIGANDHHSHAALTIGTGLNGGSYNTTNSVTISVKYGSTAGTACQGNDSRLSDARTPIAHGDDKHNCYAYARISFAKGQSQAIWSHNKGWSNYIVQLTCNSPERIAYYTNKTNSSITICLDDVAYSAMDVDVVLINASTITTSGFTIS